MEHSPVDQQISSDRSTRRPLLFTAHNTYFHKTTAKLYKERKGEREKERKTENRNTQKTICYTASKHYLSHADQHKPEHNKRKCNNNNNNNNNNNQTQNYINIRRNLKIRVPVLGDRSLKFRKKLQTTAVGLLGDVAAAGAALAISICWVMLFCTSYRTGITTENSSPTVLEELGLVSCI